LIHVKSVAATTEFRAVSIAHHVAASTEDWRLTFDGVGTVLEEVSDSRRVQKEILTAFARILSASICVTGGFASRSA